MAFKIAATSVGMGILGDTLNSEGLKSGGKTAGKFIPVAVNVQMGGYLIKKLRKLKSNSKK